MAANEQIFVGKLQFTTDNFLLAPPNLSGSVPFIDVSFPFTDDHFNHQQVSILGRMGERTISGSIKVRSLIAKKVVLQSDIALRAFDIWRSESGGSALDNWLRAERELLAM